MTGTLSISRRINHNKKKIYLTPHILLYLQNYPVNQLKLLKTHIHNQYNIEFDIGNRRDGDGAILRFTSVEKTFQFLDNISSCSQNCESMKYKVDWDWRFEVEKEKYLRDYPTYEVLTSSSHRSKAYTQEEIDTILTLKSQNMTNHLIANKIGRSYWSVVYKISELRKNGLL